MTVEIDALDRGLARSGQTVTLRRLPLIDLAGIPAVVRGYQPDELTSSITQQDSHVVISPTQINAASWPEIVIPGTKDPRVPSKNRGDICIINNVQRAVMAGVGFYVKDVLVRIELQVR